MNKIKKVSLFFRIIFQFIFVLSPIVLILYWINAPASLSLFDGVINLNSIPRIYINGLNGDSILHTLSITEKILGFCVSLIPCMIELFILYCLIKLFRLYEKDEIFSINNVRYIRYIGFGLLVGQIVHPFYEFLMGLVLTWRNPPGFRFASMTVDQTNIGILFTALLVILISWIMAEGCKLREEQQLTI